MRGSWFIKKKKNQAYLEDWYQNENTDLVDLKRQSLSSCCMVNNNNIISVSIIIFYYNDKNFDKAKWGKKTEKTQVYLLYWISGFV